MVIEPLNGGIQPSVTSRTRQATKVPLFACKARARRLLKPVRQLSVAVIQLGDHDAVLPHRFDLEFLDGFFNCVYRRRPR